MTDSSADKMEGKSWWSLPSEEWLEENPEHYRGMRGEISRLVSIESTPQDRVRALRNMLVMIVALPAFLVIALYFWYRDWMERDQK